MRLAVCGSRTLSDERVKIILLEEIEKNKGFDIDTSWADNIDIDGVLTDA
jgi:hypothetical protein